jgi:hypothetical protein
VTRGNTCAPKGEEDKIMVKDTRETLKPGTHVEVLSKKQVDGKSLCGTIVGVAANTLGTYIVEYHPGLDNGQHPENELKVIPESLCQHSTPRPF